MAAYARLQLPTILIARHMLLSQVWLVVVKRFITAASVEVNGRELSFKPFIKIKFSLFFLAILLLAECPS